MNLVKLRSATGLATLGLLALALSACSGSGHGGGNDSQGPVNAGVSSYTVGGTVSGLAAGASLTLADNATDTVTVSANQAFTFASAVKANGSYAVTIASQPTGETCSVVNASGSGMSANVTGIQVTCSATTYKLSGTASGLAAGQSVTLTNGTDSLVVTANGNFTFTTPVNSGGGYSVAVGTQPANETCSVGGGTGSGVNADVVSVALACSADSYQVGGSISGLTASQQVTLQLNGAGGLTLTANGAFTFANKVAYLGDYTVTVGTQPVGETCSVGAGTGSRLATDVTSVAITCSVNTYAVGGAVSGLASGQTVTLQDNGGGGGNVATVAANGAFSFTTPVPYGGSYAVTVGTQPVGQFCNVASGTGSGVGAAISGVAVTCTRAWYISGTGVDSHDGKTAATAWRTLNHAAAFVQPGDVVLAMNGTYTDDARGAVLGLNIPGTPDAWITYRAYPGHTPVIHTDGVWGGITVGATAQYVEVNGFTVIGNNASLTLAGAQAVETDPGDNPKYNGNCIAVIAGRPTGPYPHHIRILNNTVSECPGGGIATVGTDYLTISGNTVFNNAYYSPYGASGISTLVDYDTNPADKTTQYKIVISNNVIYGNQEFIPVWSSTAGVTLVTDGEGIIIDSNHDHDYDPNVTYPAYTGRTLIANNVVFANGSSAIEVFQSSHVDVVNNSTYGNIITPLGQSAAIANVSGRGEMNLGHISDVNVYNNIFYSRTGQPPLMQGTACADCYVDYNLYYGGANVWNKFGANGAHDKSGDPLFLNMDVSSPASVNLKLGAGSPALGAGTSHLAPSADILGNPRPGPSGYSLGAYSQ